MRLLVDVSVPITEDADEVLKQLMLSKHDYITVTCSQGVTFDLYLGDLERIGVLT